MNLFGKHIKYIFFYTKQLLRELFSQGSKHVSIRPGLGTHFTWTEVFDNIFII